MEVTLKINTRTKVGKTLLSFIEFFAKENKEVEIINTTAEKSPYNPEFVKMVKKAEKEDGVYVTADTLWEDLGL